MNGNKSKNWLLIVTALVVIVLVVGYYYFYKPTVAVKESSDDTSSIENDLKNISTDGLGSELSDIDKEL